MNRAIGGAAPPSTAPAAADPAPGRWTALRERYADWRNRTVARPGFQRWAAAVPLTRPLARRNASALFDVVAGFVYAQVLLACVRLRLFDLLAGGPMTIASVAERCALPIDAARRLAAAGASLRLLALRSGDRVALGSLGAPMVGNRALAAMVEHHATLYADLADPVALLRGDGSMQPRMAGYWPYAAAAESGSMQSPAALPADRVSDYSALMSASQPLVTQQVLGAYRFARHRMLLDVGGGEGSFVGAVAEQAPHLRLALFDLPAVATRASARFAAAGIEHRAKACGGDFFTDPLPAGADIVSLVRVCFDHPDERVLLLLKNVRKALPPDGCVLLAEPMAGVTGAAAMADAYFGFYLLAMGRGRARTPAELRRLLVAAGFDGGRLLKTHLPLQCSVLLARCAGVNPERTSVQIA